MIGGGGVPHLFLSLSLTHSQPLPSISSNGLGEEEERTADASLGETIGIIDAPSR
jgi:hypothetical protein